jgi:hypothetical protein
MSAPSEEAALTTPTNAGVGAAQTTGIPTSAVNGSGAENSTPPRVAIITGTLPPIQDEHIASGCSVFLPAKGGNSDVWAHFRIIKDGVDLPEVLKNHLGRKVRV